MKLITPKVLNNIRCLNMKDVNKHTEGLYCTLFFPLGDQPSLFPWFFLVHVIMVRREDPGLLWVPNCHHCPHPLSAMCTHSDCSKNEQHKAQTRTNQSPPWGFCLTQEKRCSLSGISGFYRWCGPGASSQHYLPPGGEKEANTERSNQKVEPEPCWEFSHI